jgi:NMD protein affecting ribosome stability and mRNA decay
MNAMKRHQLSKHNDQKTTFVCSICNAVFKTKWSMSTHKSKYHREKTLLLDTQTGATVQVQEQRLYSPGKKTKKLDITGTIKEEMM